MRKKNLTTAEYIKYMKDKARRSEIKALAADDPEQRKEYERRALVQQITVERLQKIYGAGICTAVRKF